MKVLVCGSRDWVDWKLIRLVVSQLPKDCLVIHGGAAGADSMAGYVAKQLGLSVKVFPAQWDRFGRAAGYVRNIEMLDQNPDLVIAFHDGKSKGTKHSVMEAKKRNIKTSVYGP